MSEYKEINKDKDLLELLTIDKASEHLAASILE